MTKETPRTSAGSSGAQHCTKFKTGKLLSPLFFCAITSTERTDTNEKKQYHKRLPVITHKNASCVITRRQNYARGQISSSLKK